MKQQQVRHVHAVYALSAAPPRNARMQHRAVTDELSSVLADGYLEDLHSTPILTLIAVARCACRLLETCMQD